MVDTFDLIVIGSGAAGLVASGFASSLGLRVALISDGKPGGECLWSGCVPSKALIHKAAELHVARKYSSDIDLDVAFQKAMSHMRETRRKISEHETSELLEKKYGISVIQGRARFQDRHTITCGSESLKGRKFILACGAKNRLPDVPGISAVDYLTHESILQLPSRPKSVIVMGGGPVGVEFAQMLRRFGVDVHLVEKHERLLRKEEIETSAIVEDKLRSEGVELLLSSQVVALSMDDGRVSTMVRSNGSERRLCSERLFVAVGKEGGARELSPEIAGVELDEHGFVKVDRHQRTTAPHIWACGDVCGPPFFTHYADHAARVAVLNACLRIPMAREQFVIPRCTFVDPEVASVGFNEEEARTKYGDIKIFRLDMSEFDRAIVDETAGMLKIVCRKDGRILGASIVSSSAGELIHELAIAIRKNMTVQELSGMIHAYPTMSSALWNLSSLAYGELLQQSWQSKAIKKWAQLLR